PASRKPALTSPAVHGSTIYNSVSPSLPAEDADMVGCAMQNSGEAVSQPGINLLSLDEREMADLVAGFGWPAYRTAQILRWLYQRPARSISNMTDLRHLDRAKLSGRATMARPPHCLVFRSANDTRKLAVHL